MQPQNCLGKELSTFMNKTDLSKVLIFYVGVIFARWLVEMQVASNMCVSDPSLYTDALLKSV